MNQTSDDIKLKMNKDQGNADDEEHDKEDHKPTAQEKKQAEETQDNSDSDDDGPMKKKRKKESFSLGKDLCQYIDLDDGQPSNIDTRMPQGEVQEAHQRLAEFACLHVSFTAYENFYKLSKMHCHLILTFHFLILRMSEYRNPTIKHISTYTLVSSSITTYVTDLFLGSNPHSKIPF